MKMKDVINEIKNHYYVNNKLIIVENVNNKWGYKIFNESGKLIKTKYSDLYNKEFAYELAEKFAKKN